MSPLSPLGISTVLPSENVTCLSPFGKSSIETTVIDVPGLPSLPFLPSLPASPFSPLGIKIELPSENSIVVPRSDSGVATTLIESPLSPFGIVTVLPSVNVTRVSPFGNFVWLLTVIESPIGPTGPLSPGSPFGTDTELLSLKVTLVSPFGNL